MNDRFKFRFWDKDRKIMIDENSDIEYIANIYGRGEWWGCIEAKMPKILSCFDTECFAIMQCTGLKDKNGTLIYEGDIVRLPDEDLPYMIDYDEYTARYIIHSDIERIAYCFDNYYGEELEVIGNIYENKELLESEG